MAGVQGSAMAVAVSNAGGLGSLPCAMLTLDVLRSGLQAITSQTSQPYNVNFFCHTPPVPDTAREAAWRAALAPYYAQHGINAATISAGAGRAPFTHEAADVLEAFKPPVVSFHFGLPKPELLARVKAWGAVVLSSATTVAEARWLEANGADAVIAQGLEAGGHRAVFLAEHLTGNWTFDLSTQQGTFTLLPQIVAAVRCPVIAAGGIADAAGVRAAMALGAAGVQVGTAYLLCTEATTSAVHRAALQTLLGLTVRQGEALALAGGDDLLGRVLHLFDAQIQTAALVAAQDLDGDLLTFAQKFLDARAGAALRPGTGFSHRHRWNSAFASGS